MPEFVAGSQRAFQGAMVAVDVAGKVCDDQAMTNTTPQYSVSELVAVPDLRTGDRVNVGGHILQTTERTYHYDGRVSNWATVLVESLPDADPFVAAMIADTPCVCERVCQGWHLQGNHSATVAVVAWR